ncbi:hypothetical protein ACFDTO_12555 [Microbacteriaceae bacterium 4G12]
MEEKENTVVLFPNLANRLREKGFDALHHKQFTEALDCFEQLRSYNLHDEQSEFAAVICLLESGQLRAAKQRCEELFHDSKKRQPDVLEMYLTILVQLQDYKAIVQTIEAELHNEHILDEQREKLVNLFSFARKMQEEQDDPILDEEEFTAVFQGTDIAKQLQALQEMKQRGTVTVFPFLQEFLSDDTKHPYVKSNVLYALMEFHAQGEVTVTKFGREMTVNVSELSTREPSFETAVLEQLERGVGSKNPTMFQAVADYWQQMLYLLFPFYPNPENELLWAAVLEKIGCERFYIPAEDEEIANFYGVTISDLEDAYRLFLHIEKDGYLTV